MFSVARLRQALAVFLLSSTIPQVDARLDSLFTNSVTYCADPKSLLVQKFDLAYFASNNSVSFDITAASVLPDLNVSANLLLNVYGMHLVNFTVDLCSILNGALCPLPTYNFNGTDSLPLPSTLDVASRVPGIAFKIPDLEAFAQLTLYEKGTNEVVACVQATLSNGWSTRQTAVQWATGAVAFLALIPAVLYTLLPENIFAFRLLDILSLFQTIATSALLSLNYPLAYRSFATNFSWAVGLFSGNSLQSSINHLRSKTGGTLAGSDGADGGIAFVNRGLSPYNVGGTAAAAALSQSSAGVNPTTDVVQTFAKSRVFAAASPYQVLSVARDEVQTVTTTSSNVLDAGVPIYVNALGIPTDNATMTVFLVSLIVLAIALASLGVAYGAMHFLSRRHDAAADAKDRFPSIAKSWLLRLALVYFLPATVFAFYQWTLHDSWATTFFSVILLLAIIPAIAWAAFVTIRLGRTSSPLSLYSHTDHLRTYGALYANYRPDRFFFFAPVLLAAFLKALVIGFVANHGQTQIILILLIELGTLTALIALKPHKTRGGDVLSGFLAVVRVVCAGLMIAFIERLHVAAIPRVAIGIVIAVIFSITVVVIFFNLMLHICIALFRRRRDRAQTVRDDSSQAPDSLAEKAQPQMRERRTSPTSSSLQETDVDIAALPQTPITATTDLRHSSYSDRTYGQEPWSHARSSRADSDLGSSESLHGLTGDRNGLPRR